MKRIKVIGIVLALAMAAIFAMVSLPATAHARQSTPIILKGETIKGKAWRPDFGEVASWSKEKMGSNRLEKKESFLPRIINSVKKAPF